MHAIRKVPSARTVLANVVKVGAEIERETVGQKAGSQAARQAARHVKIGPVVSPNHVLLELLQYSLIWQQVR